MNIPLIVFSIFAFVCLILLVSILFSFARGRGSSALGATRILLVIVGLYGAVLLTTKLAMPVLVLAATDVQYSGDWSISAPSLRRVPHDQDEIYEIDFLLANHGTKPVSGEHLVAYLLSEDGKRYNPDPQPSTPAFDTEIAPGKNLITTRRFVLPTNLNRVELVVAHEGFGLAWFLIGRTPFDGHTVMHLQ